MAFNPLDLREEQRAVTDDAQTRARRLLSARDRGAPRQAARRSHQLADRRRGGGRSAHRRRDRDDVLRCCWPPATSRRPILSATACWTLLRHPDELRKLRDDPALIKNAVEEILRFESPGGADGAHSGRRTWRSAAARSAGRVDRHLLAAANRDPGGLPGARPLRHHAARTSRHHSFGGGVHFCLGAPLARLEAQIAIVALVGRFPNLRLADEPLEWRGVPTFRGLAKLFVSV